MLERTPQEYERLRSQARMWEPETARLLDRVGLARGARCLDVGCGPGETMRLMAERVGPAGEVAGVDVDASLGFQAVETLHADGHLQCRFETANVETGEPIAGAPFDLVFARLLLIHVDDPVAVLRRLWEWVAPGGHLVIQDYDLLTGAVVPRLDSAEAGLGDPDGIESAARLGPLSEIAPMYEAVYRSVLPAALSLGVTTEERAATWFEAFTRDSAAAGEHAALWPLLIGTWKRKALDS